MAYSRPAGNPPLDQYVKLQEIRDEILVDDAHALGVVGKRDWNWEEKGDDRRFIYQTGTLSKGFGVFGGLFPATQA